MKKSDNIRRRTWRMLAKNLIVLVALAVAAAVGVRSWFVNSTKAHASNANVTVKCPNSLEVAIVAPGETPDDDSWVEGSEINLNATNYPFISNLTISEVTSDGVNFVKPLLIQSGASVSPDTSPASEWANGTANIEYLSFDVYMRSVAHIDVKLAESTTISPISAQLITSNGVSRDCAIGAVRFSVVAPGEDEASLLWIPAPNVYYDSANDDVTDDNTSGSSYTHKYYSVGEVQQNGDTEKNLNIYSGTVTNNDCDYTLGQDITLSTLSKDSEEDLYYTGCVRFNLWIEGEDEEARLKFVGGQFAAVLNLEIV